MAALRTRCDASSDRWLLEVLAISYADANASNEDGTLATRLTFAEKIRALELQGKALALLKEGLELRSTDEPRRGRLSMSTTSRRPVFHAATQRSVICPGPGEAV